MLSNRHIFTGKHMHDCKPTLTVLSDAGESMNVVVLSTERPDNVVTITLARWLRAIYPDGPLTFYDDL